MLSVKSILALLLVGHCSECFKISIHRWDRQNHKIATNQLKGQETAKCKACWHYNSFSTLPRDVISYISCTAKCAIEGTEVIMDFWMGAAYVAKVWLRCFTVYNKNAANKYNCIFLLSGCVHMCHDTLELFIIILPLFPTYFFCFCCHFSTACMPIQINATCILS